MTLTSYADMTPILNDENSPKGPVVWVLEKSDLIPMLEAVASSCTVVMDLETTGLDPHSVTGGLSNGGVAARAAFASLTLPQKDGSGWWDGEEPTTYLVPLSHPRSPFLGEWAKVLRLIARTMVKYRSQYVNAHAKFDAHWVLSTTGIDITGNIVWDTQSSSHLIDETRPTALKSVAPSTFNIPPWDDLVLNYPGAAEDVDIWVLGDYAARDTYWSWRLYLAHLAQLFLNPPPEEGHMPIGEEEVADARLGQVARYVSMPTAKCLGFMEQRGIRLDIGYTRNLLSEQSQIASERLDWLSDRYGLDRGKASGHATSGWFKELTALAMEEGELQLAAMTKGGNPQWNKFVLAKQARQGSETARMILEQRDSERQAQFLSSWLEKVSPDGMIHSSYRAGHVATGRLSSADPNMQQVSRKLRGAFIPRDGYYLADLDYSQLELRVTAFISRCRPMIEAYLSGQDLHTLLAADILTRRRWHDDPSAPTVPLAEVTEKDRDMGKAGNFGLIYGQQVHGFRNYAENQWGVVLTEGEAQDVHDGFFETWDGIGQWHERVKREAASKGYVTSPIGRRRLLPHIYDGNEYLRGEAERQAFNSPVQGFGSDLMQMALASIYGHMPSPGLGHSFPAVEGVFPVATVHDSLVAEVRADAWEEVVEQCRERMVNLDPWLNRMGVEMDVPLVADFVVGSRWGMADISHPS